ncbi:MAG TPA: galactokinase [Thermoleophilaceae bacterium]|nr:galactokinase [Thermoleophilaceae bacterium]
MSQPRFRAFAPGRVNLVGEHTDYNDGLCLPFAIERGITVTAEPLRHGRYVEARAVDLSQHDRFSLDAEIDAGAPDGWRRFVRGAAAELRREGVEPAPCRLEITGNVPAGAGLSSSAALSIALCLALWAVVGDEPPERMGLARLCSRIENDWCGQRTGLLDQLASLYGEEGHAVRIDMRGPHIRPVGLDLAGHRLAALDSGARRSLAHSSYNERRNECRRVAALLGLASLRDARAGDLADLPEPLRRRARHVLSENERVDATVAALARGDLAEVGRLLDASHASLRDDYDVSVPEVERAVRKCRRAGAIGARIVGGGFGGSVLALFPPGCEPPEGAVAVAPAPGARLL